MEQRPEPWELEGLEWPWELVNTPCGHSQPAGPEATQCHPVPSARKKVLPAVPALQGSGHQPLQLPTYSMPGGGIRDGGKQELFLLWLYRLLDSYDVCVPAQSLSHVQLCDPGDCSLPTQGRPHLRFLDWQADSLPLSHFYVWEALFIHRKGL